MNLFDHLVTNVLENQPQLSVLRTVVEKELLHHDILRILSQNKLLNQLTFIGGTALRSCYDGIRLSEDLDFTGGNDFSREQLSEMGKLLVSQLNEKYNLPVTVSEPVKDTGNVDTWKIKVETRPQQKHFPAQRINIDICAVASYESKAVLLLNPYGVDMGTGGLVIQTQSREEIYTDKLLAFALRPNRIKYRDLWDIAWLHQQGLKPRIELLPHKLKDRSLSWEYFCNQFKERFVFLSENTHLEAEFRKEMQRFLPLPQKGIIEQPRWWSAVIYLVDELMNKINNTRG